MTDPHDQPTNGASRLAAQAGMAVAALGVFTCGWLAMRTDDWRKMVLFTALAMGAALVGSAFSRRAR